MGQPEPESWERFLRYAARARSKPSFDLEERDYRLQVAQRLQGMLSSIRQGLTTVTLALETVFIGRFSGQAYSLTDLSHSNWLKLWASSDEDSLVSALATFTEEGDAPEARFGRFVEAAERANTQHGIDLSAGPLLELGSLLNFAVAPLALPVVNQAEYERLMEVLGYEREGPLVTQTYERALQFFHEVERQLLERGVPIRDMVDVQSVVSVAVEEARLWISESPPPPIDRQEPSRRSAGTKAPRGERPYLSVCAIYRDEADDLPEWIEFHRLVGVERFFLYDNGSSDHHAEILAPYIDAGIVVLHDWPVFPAGQHPAYEHCLETYRHDSRWIAFIDVDEFLFSPTGEPVAVLLEDYEDWPGVAVGIALYGSSGHHTRPPGLVIESYLERSALQDRRIVKSVVDPTRTVRCKSVHHFEYRDLTAVDENGYPITGFRVKWLSASRLRVNHYWMKSEEEFRAKFATPQAADARFRPWPDLVRLRGHFHETDTAIVGYLPELRAAMSASLAAGMESAQSTQSGQKA
jgi:glycosyl transferase family 92